MKNERECSPRGLSRICFSRRSWAAVSQETLPIHVLAQGTVEWPNNAQTNYLPAKLPFCFTLIQPKKIIFCVCSLLLSVEIVLLFECFIQFLNTLITPFYSTLNHRLGFSMSNAHGCFKIDLKKHPPLPLTLLQCGFLFVAPISPLLLPWRLLNLFF